MPDLDTTFDKAVAHIGSSSASTSNDVKLELYANYKIATTAVTPLDVDLSRPGMFDFAGRAKYDAWAKCGKELQQAHPGKGKDDLVHIAKARYIDIAKQKFAFDECQDAMEIKVAPEAREKTADELLDEDEEGPPPHPSGSTGGMSVSKMSMQPSGTSDNESASPLHDFSSRGDVKGIQALRPTVSQLNALNPNGFAAIHLAADKGHVQVVQLLIAMGADPNRPDSEGMTALDTAEAVENKEIIEILKTYAP